MQTRWTCKALLAALALSSQAFAQAPAAKPAAKPDAKPEAIKAAVSADTPLIPRATLFGNPDRGGAQISPDGKNLAWLADVKGVLNVFVAPADDLTKAKAVTNDTKRNIRQYFWSFDNTHILYLQDQGGDENWKVYATDITSGQSKDLTPFEDIKGPDGKPMVINGKTLRPAAQIQEVSERFPGEILVALNNRDPRFHDVYKVNIASGKMDLVLKNNEWASITTDDAFTPRFAQKLTADGGTEISKLTKDGDTFKAELFEKIPASDSLTTGLSGFDKSGKIAYMNDSRGRDTGALFAIDLATGKKTLVAEDPRCDVGGVIAHPTEKTIQAVGFNYLKTEWKVLDKAIQTDLDYLKTVNPGEVNIAGRTLDDKRWIVAFTTDDGPTKVFLYDRAEAGKAGKAKFLFTNRTKLEGLALSKMRPTVIKSRDGMNLVSYLTLPAGRDANNDGTPDAGPLPMVLFVHGGPWARDNWGYNPYHQWLANRGYAVLSVNFRGSTGFGKNFVNAGNMQWAAKMHDDLLDAVNWAVEHKVAQKDKVAIMGGSYGGYATLVGLTFTPDTFACGVDIVGPSNIVSLLNSIPEYWKPMLDVFATRVGDHRTEEGRKFLESRSPLTFADRIRKPLLIGQGANDPRVNQAESDQIVKAMQAKSIPVTYVLFPDEGHGFARPENNTAFNAVTEAFLSKHLGGRFEPIGGDLSSSKTSVKIEAGAEGIPGLSASIPTK